MPARAPLTTARIRHGFPSLQIIKQSIKLLYKHLSKETINSFATSLSPAAATLCRESHITIAVQRLAGVIARHLRLPTGCIIVNFRDMQDAGHVELASEDDYLVELHSRYRDDPQDIAALLAHEATHAFLHRRDIRFFDTWENEILTDTAALYLGVGWLGLNGHRVIEQRKECGSGADRGEPRITKTKQIIGYLTPEESGYVLGKRSLALGEKVDHLITSPAVSTSAVAGKTGCR